MNLKLLLTAALSTAALAAHADVQLYGSIKSGIETSQTRFGGQTYSRTFFCLKMRKKGIN